MANWICIYSIVTAPVIWFLQHMLCCVDGTFADESDSAVFRVLSARLQFHFGRLDDGRGAWIFRDGPGTQPAEGAPL
jgi:hypothetical protein